MANQQHLDILHQDAEAWSWLWHNLDIGGEFKNRARTVQKEVKNHAQFDNSPPIST